MPWRLVPILALLAMPIGCAPTHLDLPRTTGGRPMPADAVVVRFVIMDRDHAVVRVGMPDGSVTDSVLTPPEDPLWGDSIRGLVLHQTLDAAKRRPAAEEIPVVFVLDDELPLIIARDVLFEPAQQAARQDPRIQLMLAVGDSDGPEVIDVPDDAPPLGIGHPGRAQFVVRGTSTAMSGDPSLSVCTFAPGATLGDMAVCATLLEEEPAPIADDPTRLYLADANPTYAPLTPEFMSELCLALDEPFDLEWKGETIEDLARIATEDPRPPRCRGGLWTSRWWYEDHDGVRPSELRPWRRSLAKGE